MDDDVAMTPTPTSALAQKNQMTGGCTLEEDRCICRSWLEISQDPICGAEQKEKIVLEEGYPRFSRE
jgi:hypothetical protein